MRLVFFHHEAHGPLDLDAIWRGEQGFGGSVARLRILFWVAKLGHEVFLVGNVKDAQVRGVVARQGSAALRELAGSASPQETVVVLNNHCPDEVWNALASVERPIIVWAGNPFPVEWMGRLRSGRPARIVCVSEYHRDLYRIYPGFERVEMTYTGMDLDLLADAKPSSAAEGAFVFASIPRRTKGIHNLLEAWRIVRATHPTARLRICGSARMHDPRAPLGPTGILDADVEAAFPDLFENGVPREGIELLGVRTLDQVYGEMKTARGVLVNCNWSGSFETYCRAAVEAQAAGAPVLGARRGSLYEVVASGRTGLMVDRALPAGLAAQMARLLDEQGLRDALGREAARWILPMADYATLAPEWIGIAQRALSGAPAPAPRRWGRDVLRMIGYGAVRARARGAIRGSRLEKALLGR